MEMSAMKPATRMNNMRNNNCQRRSDNTTTIATTGADVVSMKIH